MEPKTVARESSLFRNTWLNLLGQGIPLALAFFVLPILLRWIGPERMGVLTTLWVVIGYFLLLDMGLGRAVVHMVADRVAAGRRDEVPDYVWPALFIIGGVSLIGAVIVGACAPLLVELLLNVPEGLRSETNSAFLAVSLSLPLVTLTSCLRGVLEAKQKFFGANVLQGFSSGANAIVPLIAAFSTPSLAVMAWSLMAARALLLIAHLVMALREFPELKRRPEFSRAKMRRLFHFGGWSTVSNIVGPVMVYLDRLMVGARVEASVVPIYAIPHEAVTRLLILPTAMARALFPKMSSLHHDERLDLSKRVVSLATFAIFPIVVVMVYFAEDALSLWLGADMGMKSAPILKILAVGYFLNASAYVPFTQLQSHERPDLTARVHLVELPFYLVLLFFLTSRYGAQGAAWAWLLRVAVDTVAMFILAARVQKGSRVWDETWGVVLGAALLVPGVWLRGVEWRAGAGIVALLLFSHVTWHYWFDGDTRRWVLGKLRFNV